MIKDVRHGTKTGAGVFYGFCHMDYIKMHLTDEAAPKI
jgi:hypothetical protein